MSVYSDNKAYLKSLIRDLKQIPKEAAVEIGTRIFLECVDATPTDSGQAMANWKMEPFNGSPNIDNFEMMWGYGLDKPTEPVGYKWSKGSTEEEVKMYQYEVAIQSMAAFSKLTFNGIVVYNPLSNDIPGFYPGTSEFYEENSIGKVQVSAIIGRATAAGYEAVKKNFDFLRK